MIYRTYLINFGYSCYMGSNLDQARSAAVAAGFECVIYCDDQPILSYAPLSGWRGLVASSQQCG
jgi:hypothetical protein